MVELKKLRLYKYPHAIGHLHDTIPEYRNTVPFSADGIAKWCELVEPQDADLFYCGQFHDQRSDLLMPDRFNYFPGHEERHLFDIEGDWNGKTIPDWLRPCLLTAMNAEAKHKSWKLMMRPPCSKLLMDIVRNPRPYTPPKRHGIFFRGQPDRHGVRERMLDAVKASGIPYQWEWTRQWNAPTPADDPVVTEYERDLLEWSMVACPAGEGQQTCRFYETCGLGRLPVVFADGLLFGDFRMLPRIFTSTPMDCLIESIRRIHRAGTGFLPVMTNYSRRVNQYFEDPTLYWMHNFID